MVRQAKAQRILTHDQIWGALDRLAERAGLSPSGLAKRAGLDPTTFNKSKRVTPDGRERWPSTESIAKALAATDILDRHFLQLIGDDGARRPQRCRCSASRKPARAAISTSPAFPPARAGPKSRFPRRGQSRLCAGDFRRCAAPAYRDGDIILVSPGAPIRRGDRVVVKTKRRGDGRELKRRTAKALELQPLDADRKPSVRWRRARSAWIARIVWASQ